MAALRELRRGIRRAAGFPHPRDQHTAAARAFSEIDRGLAAVRRVLDCSESEFRSRDFLIGSLLDFGLSVQGRDWPLFQKFSDHINETSFGTLQYPTEFVDFLMECARHDIETAAEIGVWHGGSSYFAAAVLQRANPRLEYTMIDIADHLLGFDAFSAILNLKRRIPSTAQDHAGEAFDLVFIDADHSYAGAKGDYEALGRYARKLVAFHDIHAHEYDHLDGGVVRFWNELCEEACTSHRIVEFAHSPVRWMGIGMVDMR